MPFPNSLSGPELIALASVFALGLSENRSAAEIGTLAAFFSALADNLALLATTDIDDTLDS